MPDSIQITLPFPPKELSPNARLHWAKKSPFAIAQRDAGFYWARPYRGKIGMEYCFLSLVFFPPTNRFYDADNLLARMKAALDGVAKGLGINDKQFRPIMIDFGAADKENPHVDLTITEAA